jgi:hypothetical protein
MLVVGPGPHRIGDSSFGIISAEKVYLLTTDIQA